jgi:hypothetical protein
MIFDDLENDEMIATNFNRTKASTKSLEFGTSLDNANMDGQAEQRSSAPIYEVFQIQLNERFFTMPVAPKRERAEKRREDPSINGAGDCFLQIRDPNILSDELSQMSMGLSRGCNDEERAKNFEALQEDSFSTDSMSSSEFSDNELVIKKSSRSSSIKIVSIKEEQFSNIKGRNRHSLSKGANKKPQKPALEKTRLLENHIPLTKPRSTHDLICHHLSSLTSVKKGISVQSYTNIGRHIDDGIQSLVSLDCIPDTANNYFMSPHNNCSLCAKPFQVKELVARIIVCGHNFHKSCLEPLIETEKANGRRTHCPNCKLDL